MKTAVAYPVPPYRLEVPFRYAAYRYAYCTLLPSSANNSLKVIPSKSEVIILVTGHSTYEIRDKAIQRAQKWYTYNSLKVISSKFEVIILVTGHSTHEIRDKAIQKDKSGTPTIA